MVSVMQGSIAMKYALFDFPPSVTDVSQEHGTAGRCDGASPKDYVYHVAISIESFLYIYQRINHPKTRSRDASHREYQVKELMDVTKLFASTQTCYYISIELKLGNQW